MFLRSAWPPHVKKDTALPQVVVWSGQRDEGLLQRPQYGNPIFPFEL